MTMQQNNGPQGPPPGHYLATDGRYYPVPAGHVLGADGNVYPVAATSPTRTSAWEWNAASFLTLGGASAIVIGAFLPWATVGPFSAAGTDGDGIITLFLGLLAGALGGAGILKRNTGLLVASLLAAVVVLLIGVYDMANIGSQTDGPFGIEATIGGGLYLTVVGAVAAAVGPIVAMARRNR